MKSSNLLLDYKSTEIKLEIKVFPINIYPPVNWEGLFFLKIVTKIRNRFPKTISFSLEFRNDFLSLWKIFVNEPDNDCTEDYP